MKRKRYSSNPAASHEATKPKLNMTKRAHLDEAMEKIDDADDMVRVSAEDVEHDEKEAAGNPPEPKSAASKAKSVESKHATPDAEATPDTSTLLYGRFRYIKTLGRGVFSETKLYEDRTAQGPQKLVAIKRMKPEYKNIGLNEYDVLDRLHKSASSDTSTADRHIVRKIGAFYGPEPDGTLHLMLEPLSPARVKLPKCPHNTDSTRIIGHPCHIREKAFQKLVLQVLLGINFLHSNGIIHADLHPGNILRSEETGHVKLIDFGNSIPEEALGDYESHFEVCAEGYRSPELLFEKGPVSPAIDVWALGIICVEWILTDDDPFMSHGGLVKVEGEMLSSLRDLFGCGRKSGWNYCRGGRLWDEESEATYIRGLQDDVGSLKPYLLTLTRSSELVRFIMSMLELSPKKRKTAKSLLKDDWLVDGLLGPWAEVLLPNNSTMMKSKSDIRSHADEDRWEDEETFIDEGELEARIQASHHKQTAGGGPSFPSLLVVGSSSSQKSSTKSESRLPPTPLSENNAPPSYAQKPLPRTPRKVAEPIGKTASPRSSRPGTRTPIHVRPSGLEAQVGVLQETTPLKNVDFASRSDMKQREESSKQKVMTVPPDDEDDDDDEVALL